MPLFGWGTNGIYPYGMLKWIFDLRKKVTKLNNGNVNNLNVPGENKSFRLSTSIFRNTLKKTDEEEA